MNRELVDKIASAVLYEGYILYPYRPSVKNQQRWTFGGLYPKSWSDEQNGTDPNMMQTECLVAGNGSAKVHVIIRFLHLIDRTVSDSEFRQVESLEIDGKRHQAWQEATEREVDAGEFDVKDLIHGPRQIAFDFPSQRLVETLRSADGSSAGALVREQGAVEGTIEISAVELANDLRKVTVRIFNTTQFDQPQDKSRDDALMRSLISMHVILGVREGEFVSLTDPPEIWQSKTAECRNIGTWPVLIGAGSEHDTMLSSPIILYDYPRLAPESPGDLFDATEIDEILTLRILTLTDEEKRAAASVDDRARDLLARTESLAREQLMNLHGTMRGLHPVQPEQNHG